MKTITAILECNSDGTLHLPLPPDAPQGRVKVTATVEAASMPPGGETARRGAISEALAGLRRLNPFGDAARATAWVDEMRADRPMPGGE